MIQDLVRFIHVFHGIVLSIAAVGFFALWYRTRFWLPRYVHVLAVVGLGVGIALIYLMPADAPINKQLGIWGNIVLLAICPLLVYLVFVFYGGQAAAYRRHSAIVERELVERD